MCSKHHEHITMTDRFQLIGWRWEAMARVDRGMNAKAKRIVQSKLDEAAHRTDRKQRPAAAPANV